MSGTKQLSTIGACVKTVQWIKVKYNLASLAMVCLFTGYCFAVPKLSVITVEIVG